MKIKCVLVDDNPEALDLLSIYCESHGDIQVIDTFLNGKSFLASEARREMDLCLLDIDMPGLTGIEVAQVVGGARIIFVSAHTHHAIKAFDLRVVDFVPKPVTRDRLFKALDKAIESIVKRLENEHYFFKTDLGEMRVFFEDIQYIKSSAYASRDKTLVKKDGDVCELKNYNFKDLLDILPSSSFSQINKSWIIHHDAFVSFPTKDEVCLKNPIEGENKHFTETLSKTFREAFKLKIKGK